MLIKENLTYTTRANKNCVSVLLLLIVNSVMWSITRNFSKPNEVTGSCLQSFLKKPRKIFINRVQSAEYIPKSYSTLKMADPK